MLTMIKSVPLGRSSMNCNLARVRNNIHIASEVQLKSPKHLKIRRVWVCHNCFPINSLPRCLCFPICLVWNVASDVWFESYKDQITKTPKSKRQSWLLLRSRTKPADWTGMISSLANPKVSLNSMQMETWKQILANSHKQIHQVLSAAFSIDGHFHCFIGTQNRVSLTNTPCSKLFWPLPPTEVAWKSTRSLRLQSKREV